MAKMVVDVFGRLSRAKKWRLSFINYRREFPGKYPVWKWTPSFDRYWGGKLWLLEWRGYAIELDMREDVWGDMMYGDRNRNSQNAKRLTDFTKGG